MEPPSRPSISVLNRSGVEVSTAELQRGVHAALSAHGLSEEVAVLLTDDAEVRDLNRTYRSVDAPTDVLTFVETGDIAISIPYATRQAALRGVPLAIEVAYLGIHGALHLAGFDDIEDDDRAAMQREMDRVAVSVGLPSDASWSSVLHAQEAL